VIGGKPVETPYYEVGQISTGFFFLFWAVLPLLMVAENAWINSTAVFKNNNIINK